MLTKLHNDELPSSKAADLVNYIVLESVYTYEQFLYRIRNPISNPI